MSIGDVLNASLAVFAYSIIIVPIIILLFGTIIYHYRPKYRLANGIMLATLGSFGLLIFFMVFSISLSRWDVDAANNGVALVSVILICVEILTLVIGIQSIRKRPLRTNFGA